MWDDIAFANYIVGQADADSSFYLSIRRSSNEFGIRLTPEWAITKTFDIEILEKMKKFLGIGKIAEEKHKKRMLVGGRFRVDGKECAKLVEFFEMFPLRAAKRKDFELWKRAVKILVSRQRQGGKKPETRARHAWTKEELTEMLQLRKQLYEIPSRVKRRKDLVTERELLRLEQSV